MAMLAGGMLTAPLAAEAQPPVPRIGVLGNGGHPEGSAEWGAFKQGLRELGWIDGQNVAITYRAAEGKPDRFLVLARDLVQLKADVIAAAGPPAIRAVQEATSTIPIVFVVLSDPVALGYAASLAHPGGNLTGLASQYEELITKQLQLLKEAIPRLSRIALLRHREGWLPILQAAETAAQSLGLTASSLTVEGTEFENAFRAARSEHVGAIHVLPSPIFDVHRQRLIALAARYRLPAVYELTPYAKDGGLMAYGPNIHEMFRGLAGYVDRILKGAQPAELPIERPTKFELVINLKTAKALGLTIPPSLLLRADQVIQ
jgi:putative ABC transport system substrate-binding protein